jgi:MYXO-CTERM domain-containing protein
MRKSFVSAVLTPCLVLVALAGASCASDTAEPPGLEESAFQLAAKEANVPRDLLVAIAVVEEGLPMPRYRNVPVEVEVPAAGPLMLRHGAFNSLARGAELMATTEHELRKDSDLALRAGAKVVAELGIKFGANSGDIHSYREALEELSGFSDERHRRQYAVSVYSALAKGGAFEGRDGETIQLPPREVPMKLRLLNESGLAPQALPEYPGAEVFPIPAAKESGKMQKGRSGAKVEYIVIHDTEGGWTGSVATLQNDPGKSCHYIIDKNGRIGQFMSEMDTGWHSGNSHYNRRSVGIEHVGFAAQLFPETQYVASAKMVAALTAKYNIPKDRSHIIGHDQVPDGGQIPQDSPPCVDTRTKCNASSKYGGASNHHDPGIWEWETYMPRFGGLAKCTDATANWKCADMTQQAFRCASGSVEYLTCKDACVKKGATEDDICVGVPTPTPVDAGSDASGDAGTIPATDDATITPSPKPTPPTTPPVSPTPGAAPAPIDDGGCGCRTSTPSSVALPWSVGLVGLGLVLRRRKPRREAKGRL